MVKLFTWIIISVIVCFGLLVTFICTQDSPRYNFASRWELIYIVLVLECNYACNIKMCLARVSECLTSIFTFLR